MDEVHRRLERIYAALGATIERDLTKFEPTVTITERRLTISQDFRGGMTDAEIENRAHQLIHNIANCTEILARWANDRGQATTPIDRALAKSVPLQLMKDLSNNDKHGYPLRFSRSGRSPRLANVKRVAGLRSGPDNGGASLMMPIYGPNAGKLVGSGDVSVFITGEIVDDGDGKVADLRETQLEAIGALEEAARTMGVQF